MNKILHTTAYLPPIDYIKSIMDADLITIETHENYQKRTYRNRAVIQAANGPLTLSIPVNKQTGNHTPIDKITIEYLSNWQHDHWQAIQSAYNKSPYFEYYGYLIEPFYRKRWETLLEYNTELLRVILKIFNIDKPIHFSGTYLANPTEMVDYRDLTQQHKSGTTLFPITAYPQVFDYKHPFEGKISILDTIFNMGPDVKTYLQKL